MWLEPLYRWQQQNTPVVMVTVVQVRGHTPREVGAKMLVTAQEVWGTIGGGNLEQSAIEQARQMLQQRQASQLHTVRLTEKAGGAFGVQCCGGEVLLWMERVDNTRPCVAIFGVGHVGLALAKVLAITPCELWLVDSRPQMLLPERLKSLEGEPALLRVQAVQLLDSVVAQLPPGAHLLIMTHDHAEDLFVLEMALRRSDLGYIGLIGSKAKWQNFRAKLLAQGFSEADLAKVTTPIGLPGIAGKAPQTIAISTAAQLLPLLGFSQAWQDPTLPPRAVE